MTSVTYDRRRILCVPDNVVLLRTAFKRVMERHPFKIDAFVLLPDHLHCIWTLPHENRDFSNGFHQPCRIHPLQSGETWVGPSTKGLGVLQPSPLCPRRHIWCWMEGKRGNHVWFGHMGWVASFCWVSLRSTQPTNSGMVPYYVMSKRVVCGS